MDPSETRTSAPALDSIMERVRNAVKERTTPQSAAVFKHDDDDLFEQLESVIREQNAGTAVLLESFEALAKELRGLQEQAANGSDARALELGRESEDLSEVRDQVDQLAASAAALEAALESATARLYQIEPRMDANLAGVRLALQRAIAETAAGLEEQLRVQAEEVSRKVDAAAIEARKGGREQAEAVRAPLAAKLAELSERLKEQSTSSEAAMTKKLEEVNTRAAAEVEGLASSLRADLDRISGELRQLSERVEASESSARSSLDLHRGSISDLTERVSALVQQQGEREAARDAARAGLQELMEARATATEERLYSLEQQREKRAATLADKFAALENTMTELRLQLVERVDALERSSREAVDALDARIAAHAAANHTARSELQTLLEMRATATEERLHSLEQKRQARADAVAQQSEALENAVGELRAQVDALRARISADDTRQVAISAADAVGALQVAFTQHRTSVDERLAAVEQHLRTAVDAWRPEFVTLSEKTDALSASIEVASARAAAAGQQTGLREQVSHALEALKLRVLRLEQPPGTARAQHGALGSPPAAGAGALHYNVPHDDFDYSISEQRWRAPVADIARQTGYVDLFRDRANVVDLGCGRGEFVQLLVEAGINVRGVDGNEDMVRFCQKKNLPVVPADLFEFLKALPDGAIDAATAFQLVEHLPPERISSLVELCGRKLAPGGLFLTATINPSCPLALSNFFLDPTHVRPVPAPMLGFICEQHGFDVQFIRYSAPIGTAEVAPSVDVFGEARTDVSVYQDYALLAKKRDRTGPA